MTDDKNIDFEPDINVAPRAHVRYYNIRIDVPKRRRRAHSNMVAKATNVDIFQRQSICQAPIYHTVVYDGTSNGSIMSLAVCVSYATVLLGITHTRGSQCTQATLGKGKVTMTPTKTRENILRVFILRAYCYRDRCSLGICNLDTLLCNVAAMHHALTTYGIITSAESRSKSVYIIWWQQPPEM